MKVLRLPDLSIQLLWTSAFNHHRTIVLSLRPLTPASREEATTAAAAAWLNSTFCALHTTALALNATDKGSLRGLLAEAPCSQDCPSNGSNFYVCPFDITWRHGPHGRWQQRWQCAWREPFRLFWMRKGEIKLLLCGWVRERGRMLAL